MHLSSQLSEDSLVHDSQKKHYRRLPALSQFDATVQSIVGFGRAESVGSVVADLEIRVRQMGSEPFLGSHYSSHNVSCSRF